MRPRGEIGHGIDGLRFAAATPAGEIVNDIRKDFTPGEQDSFEVLLDTFAVPSLLATPL